MKKIPQTNGNPKEVLNGYGIFEATKFKYIFASKHSHC